MPVVPAPSLRALLRGAVRTPAAGLPPRPCATARGRGRAPVAPRESGPSRTACEGRLVMAAGS